ncbi:MAG TPA: LLM class flavin-dependent oxidoreductase [Bacillales bacterium]|nr:LLM class flavin-dependent oxidoreductase [Bacillales bacterium]
MGKRIFLNAFDMNCSGHQSPGLWTHPDDESHRYKDLDYWTDLAQILEKGKFDALFLADVLGVYDVHGGSREAAVRQAAQVPVNDPLLVIPPMAHVTKHLCFGVTYSLTYEQPYALARRLSTLDHLTKGRVAWNIVTSYLESAAKNLGMDQQIRHDERYALAEEYVDVTYKLWEGSWEDDAVIRDKESKVYTDPAKVHDIEHEGRYFRVPGVHLTEPSPQRTPVLYQAGSSPSGREFAAKHAECVFTIGQKPEIVAKYVSDIRERAQKHGRNPEDILVSSLITPIVGRTEREAWEKYEDYLSHASLEGGLALLGGWTGIDFSQFDPDEPLEYVESNAIQTAVDIFTKADPSRKWTVREMAKYAGVGGMGPVVVGDPEQVADELERWVDEGGIDGFNIAYAVTPGTFKDFAELVVPVLERRGRLNERRELPTYREKLYGKGKARLSEPHPGARYRRKAQEV